MTPIEQALFLNGNKHCVSSFHLSPEALVLTLHPWQRPHVEAHARFDRPRIVSTDDSYAEDNRELPWDVIGFDSEQLPEESWRFCLHTDGIEYVLSHLGQRLPKRPNTTSSRPAAKKQRRAADA